MSNPKLSVVIVGGGFSGTVLAAQLLRRAVPVAVTAVVELLSCGAAIAVAFRKICETFRTVEWALLSVDAVPRSHVGSIPQVCRNQHKLAKDGLRVGGRVEIAEDKILVDTGLEDFWFHECGRMEDHSRHFNNRSNGTASGRHRS